jgi:hypothetical protein
MRLLDANVFIEAKHDYYPFDVAPGYWEWLLEQHEAQRIASVEAVREELFRQEDDLATWVRTTPASFWIAESSATLPALRQVSAWAMSPSTAYRPSARSEFLAVADYRLTAAALAGGHSVATRERPAPESKRRILLPDACDAHRVAWASPFEVYRELGLRLIGP